MASSAGMVERFGGVDGVGGPVVVDRLAAMQAALRWLGPAATGSSAPPVCRWVGRASFFSVLVAETV
jgi:hypothetical protein